MSAARFLILSLAVATAAAAQRTWIVDAARGAGWDFTDIPPALAAARGGDTILIRSGSYSGGTTGKALIVIGRTGAVLRPSGTLFVVGLAGGKDFVLKGLGKLLFPLGGNAATLELVDNKGRVHVESMNVVVAWPNYPVGARNGNAITATRCSQVSIVGCELDGGAAIASTDSTVSIVSCRLRGGLADAWRNSAGHPGLLVNGGSVSWSRGTIVGGNGEPSVRLKQGPGVELTRGSLRITGDATTRIAAGLARNPLGWSGSENAIVNTGGALTIDPAVGLVSEPPTLAPIRGQATRTAMLSLTASGAPLGGRVPTELVGPPGNAAALLVSLPGDHFATPFGEIWLGPAIFTLYIRPFASGGPTRFDLPIVPVTFPRERALTFQGVVVRNNRLLLSNAATVVLD